jgi:hypothetical protein
MTSQPTIGPEQQHVEGRSVRDIVEHDPAQVNEVWCRKIFRQLLQSLELQYAMQMPHRAITPDTVVFHDNGEPLLLPSIVSDPYPHEAEDLTALARLVHFAITSEIVPEGPLRGRGLQDYSDSLITAVDRCMAPDPDQRPRSIEELRGILGIVSLGNQPLPAAPASIESEPEFAPASEPAAVPAAVPAALPAALPASEPVSMPASAPLRASGPGDLPSFMQQDSLPRREGLSRWQRWAVAAGGGAVLLAAALAMFAELRDSGSFDHIVLTLPQPGEGAKPQVPSDAPANLPQAASAADGAGSARNDALAATDAPGAMPAPAPAPAPALPQASAVPPLAPAQGAPAAGGGTYKLQIQPWGIVYVDGVDRGVSPPVKRLVLAPGRHTIRIANPNFHDRVLEVDTANGDGRITIDFRKGAP